jgi:hypothetical protein
MIVAMRVKYFVNFVGSIWSAWRAGMMCTSMEYRILAEIKMHSGAWEFGLAQRRTRAAQAILYFRQRPKTRNSQCSAAVFIIGLV